jgi:pimeloyl-ACP methyl ester carboxylesterase
VDDRRLRVCLDRTVELAGARLHLRDWPGLAGPLIHVPDPLAPDAALGAQLADMLAPRYRVLSVPPRAGSPYQVDASELWGVLDQFGFERPILVAERLGCVAGLQVAAWQPRRVAGLVLVEATFDPPASEGLFVRTLRDCPPNWAALRTAVECPLLELPHGVVEELFAFVAQLGPGVA